MSRILLLIQNKENARLLAELLSASPKESGLAAIKIASHELIVPESEARTAAVAEANYDLCILDGPCLKDCHNAAIARRAAAEPVFLPFLLAVNAQGQRLAWNSIGDGVDEIVTIPARRAEFQGRIRGLLRARTLSLALAKSNLALQQANEEQARFVSIVSHEFRNPLGLISSYTQLLQRRGEAAPAAQREQFYSKIQQAVTTLTASVDGVLTYSRIGKTQASVAQPVALGQLCARMIQEVKLSTQASQTIEFETIDLSYPAQELMVELDEPLLSHILVNLLTNAVKYSPDSSLVRLTLEPIAASQPAIAPADPPDPSTSPGHTYAGFSLCIADQGIGIPLPEQPALFDAFSRASNASDIKGTGLGLSIVKQCVELLGASITVDSQPDQGARFTVVCNQPCRCIAGTNLAPATS